MRVALVSMPWSDFNGPSAALGALAAYVRQQAPGYQVDCVNAYVDVWARMKSIYEKLAGEAGEAAECVYAVHLYPERRAGLLADCGRVFHRDSPGSVAPEPLTPDELAGALTCTEAHLTELVDELADRYEVVGFTTSMMQLFASLAAAKLLKQRSPTTQIVLGGMGTSGVAESVLREYPFVDFIVQGEGEKRLLELLRAVDGGRPAPAGHGIYSRAGAVASRSGAFTPVASVPEDLVQDLDELPVPDYLDYQARAERHGILWDVPIEGSRGCWWNRTGRTGNPRDACQFCNVNAEKGYREKTPAKIAGELNELSRRHENLRFAFLDNIARHRGLGELALALRGDRCDRRLFLEVRASMPPRDFLALWQAGCDRVQIGIEGLCTSYLQRLNKGTTTLQNLQALKICFELGIQSKSNLILDFPGATAAEVEETRRNILDYAIAYAPCAPVRYRFELFSPAFLRAEEIGVIGFGTHRALAHALPEDVFERLRLRWLEHRTQESVDWMPVIEAVQEWRQLHDQLLGSRQDLPPKPLLYFDGGSFLEIIDRRTGFKLITLDGPWREVYLGGMEIRSGTKLAARAERAGLCDRARVHSEILPALVDSKLMFEESGKYLSLAAAWRPEAAAERIQRESDPMARVK